MTRLIALSLIAVSLPAAAPDPSELAYRVGGLNGVAVGPVTAEFPRNGEGATIRLKDGRLLHAFSRHRAGQAGNPDLWPGVIAFSYSFDDGRTWSSPEVVFENREGLTAMQPSFARLRSGGIGVTYSLIESYTSARKVYRMTNDEGRTWSEPVVISPPGGYWTGAHDRLLMLSSGRLIASLHTKLTATPETLATRVAYSDNDGRSWKLSPQTLTVKDVIPGSHAGKRGQSGLHESSIVERADGSLFLVGRTLAGYLYQSVSTDQGVNWSEPARTQLVSGAAPGRIERVPGSSDLLLIWNSCCLDKENFVHGQRLTLSSAISSDGGATWKWRRPLVSLAPGTAGAPHWADYPAIYIDGGKVYFSYRLVVGRGKETYMQEHLRVLPLSWFYAERDANPTLPPADRARRLTAGELRAALAALPAEPPSNRELHTTQHTGFKVARVENRNGPNEVQATEDRVFYVLSGSAVWRVGDGGDLEMEAGSALIVPRGVSYRILAEGRKVEFLVVRIQ